MNRRFILVGLAVLLSTPFISAQMTGEGWFTFHPADASFSVDFPGGEPHTRILEVNGTPRTDYAAYADHNTFMVEVYNSGKYRVSRAGQLLHDYPNPGSSGLKGRVVESQAIENGGFPGRAVRIEGTSTTRGAAPGTITALHHAYVTDGRLVLVSVSSAPGERLSPKAERFLSSFSLRK